MSAQQPPGFLLTYLMEALEVDPNRVFDLEDLKSRGESEVDALKEGGYLIPRTGTKGATTFTATVAPMLKEVRALRHLKGSGAPKELDPRLYYLGTWTMKAEVYSWFLALVRDVAQLRDVLAKKAGRYLVGERVVIVTPGFSADVSGTTLGIPYPAEMLTLGELDLLKRRNEGVRRRLLSESASGTPSTVESEIEAHGFKVRIPIEITGIVERKDLNVINVDKIKIRMGDSFFVLLLTLMYQQCIEPSGHIDIDALEAKGLVTKERKDKTVLKLRALFAPAIRETKLLVETDREGELRLSVHRSYFRINAAGLQDHPKKAVRDLAKELHAKGIKEIGPS